MIIDLIKLTLFNILNIKQWLSRISRVIYLFKINIKVSETEIRDYYFIVIFTANNYLLNNA